MSTIAALSTCSCQKHKYWSSLICQISPDLPFSYATCPYMDIYDQSEYMLTCHMPPGLPLPSTTWSTLPSSTCLHSSKLGSSSPRSASGFCRASISRETGLLDLPSSPWVDGKYYYWCLDRDWKRKLTTMSRVLTSERNSRSCSTRERSGWSESLVCRNSSCITM